MSLPCPKCKSALFELTAGGSPLQFCTQCKGIWFEKDEFLFHLRSKTGEACLTFSDHHSRNTTLACPNCQTYLKETPYSICTDKTCAENPFLLVDFCPKCRGVWLDEGELQKTEEFAEKIPGAKAKWSPVFTGIHGQPASPRFSRSQILILSPLLAFTILFAGLLFYTRFISDAKSINPPHESETHAACPDCKGSGSLWERCAACVGRGTIQSLAPSSSACQACGGTGHLTGRSNRCFHCNGSGWTGGSNSICERCNGAGRLMEAVRKTCDHCFGTGQTLVKDGCKVCGGSGMSSINKAWKCPSCFGTRYVESKKTCPYCQGGMAETQAYKTCSVCLGNGRSTHEKTICAHCLGTGSADASSQGSLCLRCGGTGSIQSSTQISSICSQCSGKGNVLSKSPCATCKGSGVL